MTVERYRIADLQVDADHGAVLRHGRRLQLPPMSFALLLALLRHAPEIARRQDLMDEVWAGAVVSDETLSQRVRLLRESLGDSATEPRYVESVRGWGYRAASAVQRVDPSSATTVAVLPFTNLGGCSEEDPLCRGLAEEVIASLAGIEGLRVIARTSSEAVARAGLDIREAGRRLGAGSIVEGSVRRSGQRVRITVQLVETSEGKHLWSEQYDRDVGDVLDLEREIAEAVARRSREDLGSGALVHRRPMANPAAHHAYLEGRHHFHSGAGPESLARARVCLERAVALDPQSPRPFDALAELFWYLGFFGGMPPKDAFSQGTWYALRALELDERLADTHALLGMLRKELDYNWLEVDRELARARELDHDSPAVRVRYAVAGLLPHGRLDEALEEIDRALLSDPLSLFVRWWSGTIAYLARRPGRMMDEGRRMTTMDPSHPLGHWVLGMGRELMGERAEALVELEHANRLAGGMPFTLGFLALVQGWAGRHDDVRSALARLRRSAETGYVSPFAFALAHIGLHDWDDAFRWMASAVEQRDPLIIPIKSFHFLDPVRDDPRFTPLLRAMNYL